MVYLIHLHEPYKHARHYIGFTRYGTPKLRLRHHANGNGSKFLNAVNKAGIRYYVVRMWPDATGSFERYLKTQKKAACLCPVCNKELRKRSHKFTNKIPRGVMPFVTTWTNQKTQTFVLPC